MYALINIKKKIKQKYFEKLRKKNRLKKQRLTSYIQNLIDVFT